MRAKIVFEELSVDARTVYDFARQMNNLPQWASGLASGVEQRGNLWFAQSPMGEVEIAMASENTFGVLDHDVILPDGSTVHNALRVTPAGNASMVSFVVLQTPGMTDQQHQDDADQVKRDLQALRRLLEA